MSQAVVVPTGTTFLSSKGRVIVNSVHDPMISKVRTQDLNTLKSLTVSQGTATHETCEELIRREPTAQELAQRNAELEDTLLRTMGRVLELEQQYANEKRLHEQAIQAASQANETMEQFSNEAFQLRLVTTEAQREVREAVGKRTEMEIEKNNSITRAETADKERRKANVRLGELTEFVTVQEGHLHTAQRAEWEARETAAATQLRNDEFAQQNHSLEGQRTSLTNQLMDAHSWIARLVVDLRKSHAFSSDQLFSFEDVARQALLTICGEVDEMLRESKASEKQMVQDALDAFAESLRREAAMTTQARDRETRLTTELEQRTAAMTAELVRELDAAKTRATLVDETRAAVARQTAEAKTQLQTTLTQELAVAADAARTREVQLVKDGADHEAGLVSQWQAERQATSERDAEHHKALDAHNEVAAAALQEREAQQRDERARAQAASNAREALLVLSVEQRTALHTQELQAIADAAKQQADEHDRSALARENRVVEELNQTVARLEQELLETRQNMTATEDAMRQAATAFEEEMTTTWSARVKDVVDARRADTEAAKEREIKLQETHRQNLDAELRQQFEQLAATMQRQKTNALSTLQQQKEAFQTRLNTAEETATRRQQELRDAHATQLKETTTRAGERQDALLQNVADVDAKWRRQQAEWLESQQQRDAQHQDAMRAATEEFETLERNVKESLRMAEEEASERESLLRQEIDSKNAIHEETLAKAQEAAQARETALIQDVAQKDLQLQEAQKKIEELSSAEGEQERRGLAEGLELKEKELGDLTQRHQTLVDATSQKDAQIQQLTTDVETLRASESTLRGELDVLTQKQQSANNQQ